MASNNVPQREWFCRNCGKRSALHNSKCPECHCNLTLYGDIVFVEEGETERRDPVNIFSWLIGDSASGSRKNGILVLFLILTFLLLLLLCGLLLRACSPGTPQNPVPVTTTGKTEATTAPTTQTTTPTTVPPTTVPPTTVPPTTVPPTTVPPTTVPPTTVPPTTVPPTTVPPTTVPPTTQPTEPTAAYDEFPYLDGTYKGPVISPKVPHGDGRLIWDGGSYEGNFDHGYPEDDGVFRFDDGTTITGKNWSYGTMDYLYPRGILKGEKAGTYTGLMLDGEAVGFGTLTLDYGKKFMGCFRDNVPSGTGSYYYNSGTVLTGNWDWKEQRRMELYSGKMGSTMRYTGMMLNGEACGFGMLEFEKCGSFYGEFSQDEPCGRGAYAYLCPRPASQPIMSGNDWKFIRREYAMEHTYTGLKLGKMWQGYGIGIKDSGYYYCGEIRDMYRSGYGRVFSSGNVLDHHGIHEGGGLVVRYSK